MSLTCGSGSGGTPRAPRRPRAGASLLAVTGVIVRVTSRSVRRSISPLRGSLLLLGVVVAEVGGGAGAGARAAAAALEARAARGRRRGGRPARARPAFVVQVYL